MQRVEMSRIIRLCGVLGGSWGYSYEDNHGIILPLSWDRTPRTMVIDICIYIYIYIYILYPLRTGTASRSSFLQYIEGLTCVVVTEAVVGWGATL